MSDSEHPADENFGTVAKARALVQVAATRPVATTAIVVLSLVAALLEGIGLGFILPIIDLASGGGSADENSLLDMFRATYDALNVPFTLGTVIIGVILVMTVRFSASFGVTWLTAILQNGYIGELQSRAFDAALDAEIEYFDRKGSDEILNAIVTQSHYAGRALRLVVRTMEIGLLCAVYFVIALYLSPLLTLLAALLLGGISLLLRFVIEPGEAVGGRVADANERIQEAAQAGIQGIRDVKAFGLNDELRADFERAVEQFVSSSVSLRRNEAAIHNLYRLTAASTVFGLVYVGIVYSSLSLGGLGVFLFAMFRLAPKVSTLNQKIYQAEGDLPHLVRTRAFIEQLDRYEERDTGDRVPPDRIDEIAFESVSFTYDGGTPVLREIDFTVERGEFVAFVGPSGAGKSTVVSLLMRLYEPDGGSVAANGVPIDAFDLHDWRESVAVVRQDPHVFNDTLRYNLTIGDRDASPEEIEHACEIARVDEFFDDLPNGYDTVLGDDGVRLSGGQRQRIAVARALLGDAEILVLDEATSDLDAVLEGEVHERIRAMGYTTIVVAHRLSTIVDADRIYTMYRGRITEKGSHNELITNDGTYAELQLAQSRSSRQ